MMDMKKMTKQLNPEHIAWSRRQFDMLKDGGVWGVPRSGLMFQRRGDTLVLTAEMPWMEGMDVTADQLRDQQSREYANIAEHMRAAGVKMMVDRSGQ